MRTIFSKVEWDRKSIVYLFGFVLASSIAQMVLPFLLSKMIDEGVAFLVKGRVVFYGFLMACMAVVSCIVSFGSVKLASRISTDFAYQLRRLVFTKVQCFSAVEMDRFKTASLVTRSTSDVANVQSFLTLVLRVGMMAPMMAIAGLVFSMATGGMMRSILLVAIPILLVALAFLMVLAFRYSVALRQKLDSINHLFLESLEGVRVIRAFNKQAYESDRFRKVNQDYAHTAICSGRIGSFFMPCITVIFGVTTAAVLGLGSMYVEEGTLQVASLVANSQYISMVLTSVMMLSLVILMFPTSYACAKRIEEVLQVSEVMEDGSYPLDQRPLRNTLEFKNVTFAYPGAKEAILKDISFVSRPGQVTAIVGGTGRGKSSLVKLIPRLYDPLLGEILVDGVNIKEYRKSDLCSLIGYVPQKNVLFSGDIASNLNFGKKDGKKSDWQEACRIACAEEFILKKEHQYHEMIGQGGLNVSGGQRQRLAIARALMKKAEIYIFDDSFSALDLKTDQQVRKNLKEGIKQATVLIVAQRIASIMDADQILVLDDGKIVGQGCHEELMETCPFYREMAILQGVDVCQN